MLFCPCIKRGPTEVQDPVVPPHGRPTPAMMGETKRHSTDLLAQIARLNEENGRLKNELLCRPLSPSPIKAGAQVMNEGRPSESSAEGTAPMFGSGVDSLGASVQSPPHSPPARWSLPPAAPLDQGPFPRQDRTISNESVDAQKDADPTVIADIKLELTPVQNKQALLETIRRKSTARPSANDPNLGQPSPQTETEPPQLASDSQSREEEPATVPQSREAAPTETLEQQEQSQSPLPASNRPRSRTAAQQVVRFEQSSPSSLDEVEDLRRAKRELEIKVEVLSSQRYHALEQANVESERLRVEIESLRAKLSEQADGHAARAARLRELGAEQIKRMKEEAAASVGDSQPSSLGSRSVLAMLKLFQREVLGEEMATEFEKELEQAVGSATLSPVPTRRRTLVGSSPQDPKFQTREGAFSFVQQQQPPLTPNGDDNGDGQQNECEGSKDQDGFGGGVVAVAVSDEKGNVRKRAATVSMASRELAEFQGREGGVFGFHEDGDERNAQVSQQRRRAATLIDHSESGAEFQERDAGVGNFISPEPENTNLNLQLENSKDDQHVQTLNEEIEILKHSLDVERAEKRDLEARVESLVRHGADAERNLSSSEKRAGDIITRMVEDLERYKNMHDQAVERLGAESSRASQLQSEYEARISALSCELEETRALLSKNDALRYQDEVNIQDLNQKLQDLQEKLEILQDEKSKMLEVQMQLIEVIQSRDSNQNELELKISQLESAAAAAAATITPAQPTPPIPAPETPEQLNTSGMSYSTAFDEGFTSLFTSPVSPANILGDANSATTPTSDRRTNALLNFVFSDDKTTLFDDTDVTWDSLPDDWSNVLDTPPTDQQGSTEECHTYAPVDTSDALDVLMAKFVNEDHRLLLPIQRIAPGIYSIGNRKIKCRVLKNDIYVRVGGGWREFAEFLARAKLLDATFQSVEIRDGLHILKMTDEKSEIKRGVRIAGL